MAAPLIKTTETIVNLRLSTPPQVVTNNPAVEINPKKLKQWLSELPVSNIVETVDLLNKAISGFNELQMAEADRIKLLEVYREVHDSILHSYDEMRLKQLKLPEAQRNKLAKDIMWLYLKLSHGYKIIVKNSYDSGNVPTLSNTLTLAIFRSLEMITYSLLYAYRCKTDFPPYAYIESHQLYAFAEQFNLLDQRVRAAKSYTKTPTIGGFYKLLYALIASDLKQWAPSKIELLLYVLEPFAHHCQLSRDLDIDSVKYKCMINLREDRPPSACTANNLENQNQWTRFLSLDPMTKEITAWLDKHRNNPDPFLVGHELELFPKYLDLLNARCQEIREAEAQAQQEKHVKLIIGISPIQSLLIANSVHINAGLDSQFSNWHKHTETSDDCNLTTQIRNINEDIRLGDLVALVNDDDSANTKIQNLGIIRKAELSDNQEIHLKIDYLGQQAVPLHYTIVDDSDQADSAQHSGLCLDMDSLDMDAAADKPAYLIIDKTHYQENQTYLIHIKEQIRTVKTTKLVTESIRYVVCECKDNS